MEPIDEAILLTEIKAAELLGFSTRTLQRWRKWGCGPTWYRIGERRVVYKMKDLEKWVESRKRAE